MKNILALTFVIVVAVLTGCSTPGKLIATTSTTVDHSMQAWAVYVVDGKATPDQERVVRDYKSKYDIAEDAAVDANLAFAKTGDKLTWIKARDYLRDQQANLVNLINAFTKKGVVSK